MSTTLSASVLWGALRIPCGGDPVVLGTCTFAPFFSSFSSSSPERERHRRRKEGPAELDLWGLEGRYALVLYTPHAPSSLRFYTLFPPGDAYRKGKENEREQDEWKKVSRYDFTKRGVGLEEALNEVVVEQLNAAALLQTLLHPSALLPPSALLLPPSASTPPLPQHKPTPALLPKTATLLLTLASRLSVLFPALEGVADVMDGLAGVRVFPFIFLPAGSLPWVKGTAVGDGRGTRLKDISAIAQHLSIRASQTRFFIAHLQNGALNRRDTADVRGYAGRYTEFFNTVWLLLNDLTLGLALGVFLIDNSAPLASYVHYYTELILHTLPLTSLKWLDAWPAGLKLNTQLSAFYREGGGGVVGWFWGAFLSSFSSFPSCSFPLPALPSAPEKTES
ncbi:hypothetical protein B0H34DRAFT_111407 [Crassisporium funariophilum]|nr:hypothetical protein B0H34DRAFT_111407 [Crassisporium funariophilum]